MGNFTWYVTRSTGLVGTFLIVAALLWGFLFSARATGKRPRPAWWLDLHNWLGGLGFAFVVIHIATAWIESVDIGVLQVFVPGTAHPGRLGVSVGVIATYLMAIAVFTTWPKRMSNRTWWRVMHLGSVVGVLLAVWHSFEIGSDLTRSSYRIAFVALLVFFGYAVIERLISLVQQRRRRGARTKAREQRALIAVAPTTAGLVDTDER